MFSGSANRPRSHPRSRRVSSCLHVFVVGAVEKNQPLRVRAEISSHSAAGPQARWRGASDDAYPARYVRSEQQSQRACGPQPEGARSSACLANRNRFMIDRRLSRQNVKLFLREPLDTKKHPESVGLRCRLRRVLSLQSSLKPRSSNLSGIVAMLAAVGLFALMD